MREFALSPGEVLFLTDGTHTVGILKAAGRKHIFIETENEELVQFLDPEDLVAVSCFFGGREAKEAIQCMLVLTMQTGMPLIVLPREHPATRRLPMVVSAGERIRLTSCIIPGTHPEQDVLCGKGGLDGLILTGTPGKLVVEGVGESIVAETASLLYYDLLK